MQRYTKSLGYYDSTSQIFGEILQTSLRSRHVKALLYPSETWKLFYSTCNLMVQPIALLRCTTSSICDFSEMQGHKMGLKAVSPVERRIHFSIAKGEERLGIHLHLNVSWYGSVRTPQIEGHNSSTQQ